MKKVIITGCQGSLGSILCSGLPDSLLLSCVDKVSGTGILTIDLAAEYEKLRDLVRGNDAIVHLAWDMREDYPNNTIIPENKVMAENVYRAAVESGVPRVIMASSVHANDYSTVKPGAEIKAAAESCPDTPYGATKNYIEQLGRYYARKKNLEVICIRFGGVNALDEVRYDEDPFYDRVLLYRKEFIDVVYRSLMVPKVPTGFSLFNAVSDNAGRVHSLENFLDTKTKGNESN